MTPQRKTRQQRRQRHQAREARRAKKDRKLSGMDSLQKAFVQYRQALIDGILLLMAAERGFDLQRVVCEGCGLEQEYLNADNFEGDDLDVYPCPGPLDLECGSEYCVTLEAYAV